MKGIVIGDDGEVYRCCDDDEMEDVVIMSCGYKRMKGMVVDEDGFERSVM
jgi:hypothetical protein